MTTEHTEEDYARSYAARTAIPALLDLLDQAERDRDWNLRSSRLAKEGWIKANARADRAEALIKAVRDALSNYPHACEKHPDDDVIRCGWKSAVLDVQTALGGER